MYRREKQKTLKAPPPLPVAVVVLLPVLVSASGYAFAQPGAELTAPSAAQQDPSPASVLPILDPVVISGTRIERSSFSLPMSVDVVEA